MLTEWFSNISLRLRALFRRNQLDEDLEEELRFHIASREQELRDTGMDAGEAARQARRRFGNSTGTKEATRELWTFPALEGAWKDLRYGVRVLWKKPLFTTVAVLALALGIGPNTALFSIVYSVYFDSMGYPDADRLTMVWYRTTTQNGVQNVGIAPADFRDLQNQHQVFESISQFGLLSYTLVTEDGAEAIPTQAGTPGLLSKTLKVPPMLGRDFLPEEAEPGNDHVVILTGRIWRSHFGSDPDIVGKQIRLGGDLYTVVGITAPDTVFDRVPAQLRVPLVQTGPAAQRRGPGGYMVMARLKAGLPLAQAQAAMDRMSANFARAYPDTNKDAAISVEPLRGNFVSVSQRRALWLLGITVGLVLLIACANVASLMLVRSTSRRREIAIRSSVGASRTQLFRQLLIESLTVACAGSLLGAGLGWALIRVLLTKVPELTLTAEANPTALNIPVLQFSICLALLCGILFGSVPAWRATCLNLSAEVREGAGGSFSRANLWLRRGMVVLECAAAMTLLAGATICLHSLWSRSGAEVGVGDPKDVLVFAFMPPRSVIMSGDPEQTLAFHREAIAAVAAVPGVQSAAGTATPVFFGGLEAAFEVMGGEPAPRDARPTSKVVQATSGHFTTYGIEVLRGRAFDDRDREETEQVAMVNEEFVRRYLGDADPLTVQLSVDQSVIDRQAGQLSAVVPVLRRIVGVYHDVRIADAGGSGYYSVQPQIAVPAVQGQSGGRTTFIAARSSLGGQAIRSSVAAALRTVAPDTPMMEVMTLDAMAAEQVRNERVYSVLFGLLAGLALLLAAVGVYGVLSFLVTQRTPEIGLRMALGAGRLSIIALIFREGLFLAAGGLTLGMAGALFTSRLLQALLNEVRSLNFTAFGLATVVLLLAAAAACFYPALRASNVDPMRTLRAE